MKISDRKLEQPVDVRGRIARTYLYMPDAYERFKMSNSEAKLMAGWDKMYPVSEWECERASRIKLKATKTK